MPTRKRAAARTAGRALGNRGPSSRSKPCAPTVRGASRYDRGSSGEPNRSPGVTEPEAPAGRAPPRSGPRNARFDSRRRAVAGAARPPGRLARRRGSCAAPRRTRPVRGALRRALPGTVAAAPHLSDSRRRRAVGMVTRFDRGECRSGPGHRRSGMALRGSRFGRRPARRARLDRSKRVGLADGPPRAARRIVFVKGTASLRRAARHAASEYMAGESRPAIRALRRRDARSEVSVRLTFTSG